MTAQLWCFGESGNAYKAALTLELAEYDWKPVFVDFFNGETRNSAFALLNAMAEVPVFQEGGMTLTQSAVIQLHIAEKTGKYLEGHRAEIMRWLFWENHRLSGQAGPLRFLMNFAPPDKAPGDVITYQQKRLREAFRVLDTHLTGRDWIVGLKPTIADLACCGYLYYPEPFGFDRAEWANIDRWLDNIAALPGWKHPYDLMPGNPSDRVPKEDT